MTAWLKYLWDFHARRVVFVLVLVLLAAGIVVMKALWGNSGTPTSPATSAPTTAPSVHAPRRPQQPVVAPTHMYKMPPDANSSLANSDVDAIKARAATVVEQYVLPPVRNVTTLPQFGSSLDPDTFIRQFLPALLGIDYGHVSEADAYAWAQYNQSIRPIPPGISLTLDQMQTAFAGSLFGPEDSNMPLLEPPGGRYADLASRGYQIKVDPRSIHISADPAFEQLYHTGTVPDDPNTVTRDVTLAATGWSHGHQVDPRTDITMRVTVGTAAYRSGYGWVSFDNVKQVD